MRLDKLLSNLKYATRKEVRKLAREGIITVNDKVIKDPSIHIDPINDEIKIGHETVLYHETLTLMMNKRKGTVCAHNDDLHPTVFEDLDIKYQRFDLHIAGRLDKDTEGLIIMSTDGKLVHDIISPKKDVYKTYEVFTKDVVENIDDLKRPMEILDGNNQPYTPFEPIIVSQDNQRSVIKIKEGKFHQVKRMFAHIGHEVIALKRLAIGELTLDESLSPAAHKVLNDDDLKKIFQ